MATDGNSTLAWEDTCATLEPRLLLDADLAGLVVDLNGSADGIDHAATLIENERTRIALTTDDASISLEASPVARLEIAIDRARNDHEEALRIAGATIRLNQTLVEPITLTVGASELSIQFDELSNTFTIENANGGPMDATDATTVLRNTHYINTSENPLGEVRNVTFTVTDGDGLKAEARTAIALTAFNDKPIVEDLPVRPYLPSDLRADGADVPDYSVASLIAGTTIVDPEHSEFGIAIVAADATNGTWEVQLPGSADWVILAAPDDPHSGDRTTPLPSDARLRFTPLRGSLGTADLSFHVWDGTERDGSDGTFDHPEIGLSEDILTVTATFERGTEPTLIVRVDDGLARERIIHDIQHGSGTAWQVGENYTTGSYFTANDLRRGSDGGYTYAFDGVAGDTGVATLFNARALTIEPADGAIATLDMSLDVQSVGRNDGTVHLALRQGGVAYYARDTELQTDGSQQRYFARALAAEAFVRVDGLAGRPNFEGGAPITLGIAFAGEIEADEKRFNSRVVIDNAYFEIERERAAGLIATATYPSMGGFVAIAPTVELYGDGVDPIVKLRLAVANPTDARFAILRVGDENFSLTRSSRGEVVMGSSIFEVEYDARTDVFTITNLNPNRSAIDLADLDALVQSIKYADLSSDSERIATAFSFELIDANGDRSERGGVVLHPDRPDYVVANDPRMAATTEGSVSFEFTGNAGEVAFLDGEIVRTNVDVGFYARGGGAAPMQVGAGETTIAWSLTDVNGLPMPNGTSLRIPDLSFEHAERFSIAKSDLIGFTLEADSNIIVVDEGDRLTFTAAAGDRGPANTVSLKLRDPSRFEITYTNEDPDWRNDFVHNLSNTSLFRDPIYRAAEAAPRIAFGISEPSAHEVEYRSGAAGVRIVPPTVTIDAGATGVVERAVATLTNATDSDELRLGALPDGIVGTVDRDVDGTLRVTFEGRATANAYQQALQSIEYRNIGTFTAGYDRVFTIGVWNGENGSNPAASTVALTFPALIDLNGPDEEGFGHTTIFVENGEAALLAGTNIKVTDVDDNVLEAVITLRDGRAGDTLNVDSQMLAPDFAAAAQNGTTTLAQDGELKITLYANRTVTAADWERALAAISFEASTTTPERIDEAGRSVAIQLVDEDGEVSNEAVVDVAVREVNDVPYLDLDRTDETARRGDYEGAWKEGEGAVSVNAEILIADLDDRELQSARVVAVNRERGDQLLIDGVNIEDGSSGTVNGLSWTALQVAGQLTVDLVGAAEAETYQDALSRFTFNNVADEPDGDTRRFAFSVSDGRADSPVRIARVGMETLNDPPVAEDDGPYVVIEDEIARGNVLANDYDTDGMVLRVTQFSVRGDDTVYQGGSRVAVAGVGTFVLASDGAWTFTPRANYVGDVPAVDYTIADADGATATATLTFQPVRERPDPPNAIIDRYTIAANKTVENKNILANDSDPDGDRLTVATVNGGTDFAVAGSQGGTGEFGMNGSFRFVPGDAFAELRAGETRDTEFTYTVTDPDGRTDTTRVIVTVVGVNDAPSVADASSRDNEDATQTGNLLQTATDPEGDTVTVSAFNGQPLPDDGRTLAIAISHGSLSVLTDGSFEFVPNAVANAMAEGEVATFEFPFTVSDGEKTTDAVFTLTIDGLNDPLVVIDPRVPETDPNDPEYDPRDPAVPEDPNAVVPPVALVDNTPMAPLDLTPYFADAEDDPINIVLVDAPEWLAIENGTVTGTPPADGSVGGPEGDGVYPVTVEATTPFGDSVTTTVVVEVANVPPIAADDAFATSDTLTVRGSVLEDNGMGADRDGAPDTDTLTVVSVGGSQPGQRVPGSAGGVFVVLADGTLTFDPTGDFDDLPLGTGRDTTVVYAVDDGAGGRAEATVTVTVTNANEPPRFRDPAAGETTQSGFDATPLEPIDLDAYVVDPEGAPLTYEIGEMPDWLQFDATTNSFVGMPPSDASVRGPNGDGVYPVQVRASDPVGRSFDFVHEVRIANPAPIFLGPDPFVQVPVGTPIDMPIAALFRDPDGDQLVYSVEGLPDGLRFDTKSRSIRGFAPSYVSDWNLVLRVDDGQGGTAIGAAAMSVTDRPVEPPPPEPPVVPTVTPPPSLPQPEPSEPIAVAFVPQRQTDTVPALGAAPEQQLFPSGIVLDAVNGLADLNGTAVLTEHCPIDAAVGQFDTIATPGPYLGGAIECRLTGEVCVRVEAIVDEDVVFVALIECGGELSDWRLVLHGTDTQQIDDGLVLIERSADTGRVCGDLIATLSDGRIAAVPIRMDLTSGVIERRGGIGVREPTLADNADRVERQIAAERDRGMPPNVGAPLHA